MPWCGTAKGRGKWAGVNAGRPLQQCREEVVGPVTEKVVR